MYNWGKISEEERCRLLKTRKKRSFPWHSPPHFDGKGIYHLTAANYYHNIILGNDWKRLHFFSEIFLDMLSDVGEIKAWCILPNHYHVLLSLSDLKEVVGVLGQLHGMTSKRWNEEDRKQGRKCWHRAADRRIRNSNHFYATLNYIHHNPVKHNLVKKWGDWPFSSADQFLQEVGQEQALMFWRQYPLFDYGKGWDDEKF